jgi:signal transduction histidine kinase
LFKIHQVFIIKFLILFVGAILISSLITYVSIKSIIIEHNQNYLQNVISLVNIDAKTTNNLDKFVKNIHKKTNLRVTIMDFDGVVIAESYTNKITSSDSLYVTKKIIYKKQVVFLRISKSLETIMQSLYDLWLKLTIVLILIVLSVLYMANGMSKRVVYDIEQITSYLSEISSKNYQAVIKIKYFKEFLHIALLLKDLVKKLDKKSRQKRKYIAELSLMHKQRNDILSIVSNQFKNPIDYIIDYTKTIQDDTDMPLINRKMLLSEIEFNSELISKMLNKLSLFAKLENDDLNIDISEFDLSLLCHEIATKYKDRNILIDVKSTKVTTDKNMLELVIMNLLDNALKYSKSDIKIFLDKNILSIEDRGIGIKEEHIINVTSKFFRVDKNSLDNSMGIGLAIVSNILKALNSSLEIKSTFGEGSVFSFKITNISI